MTGIVFGQKYRWVREPWRGVFMVQGSQLTTSAVRLHYQYESGEDGWILESYFGMNGFEVEPVETQAIEPLSERLLARVAAIITRQFEEVSPYVKACIDSVAREIVTTLMRDHQITDRKASS